MVRTATCLLLSALLAAAMAAPMAAQCVNVSPPLSTGCGHSSPWGIPSISCNGAPSLGNLSFALTTFTPCVTGAPTSSLLLVGTCLPAPIQFLDGPATGLCIAEAFCALYVNAICVMPGYPTTSGFVHPAPIPNDPQLVGLQLCVQAANTCAGMSCVMATNAVRVTVF